MDLFGVIGSLCFAFCLLPQVVKVFRERSAVGLSWLFIWLSVGGNVACCVYVLYTNFLSGVWQWPLYFNYAFALIQCVLLVVAKVRFKNVGKSEAEYLKEKIKRIDEISTNRLKANFDLLDEKVNLKFKINRLEDFIKSKGYDINQFDDPKKE